MKTVIFRKRIPPSYFRTMGNDFNRKTINASAKEMKPLGDMVIANLRTVIPRGIDAKDISSEIQQKKFKANLLLIFTGDSNAWKLLDEWNSGMSPVTHEIIELTPEEAADEANKLVIDYERRGWDWKNSRTYIKILTEHKLIRKKKTSTDIQGKHMGSGTHAIEKTADRLVEKSFVPALNKQIEKIISEIG